MLRVSVASSFPTLLTGEIVNVQGRSYPVTRVIEIVRLKAGSKFLAIYDGADVLVEFYLPP